MHFSGKEEYKPVQNSDILMEWLLSSKQEAITKLANTIGVFKRV